MKKSLVLLIVTTFWFIVGMATVNAAPMVWMDIGQDNTQDTMYSLMAGDTFVADVIISDLPEVYSMAFSITFDPNQISLMEAQVNDVDWPFKPTVIQDQNSAQLAGGATLGTPNSGTVRLGTLTFQCLAPGISMLDLGPTTETGLGFYTGAGAKIDDTIVWQGVEVQQSVVPIPPSALLFGFGLLGLVGYGRKKISL